GRSRPTTARYSPSSTFRPVTAAPLAATTRSASSPSTTRSFWDSSVERADARRYNGATGGDVDARFARSPEPAPVLGDLPAPRAARAPARGRGAPRPPARRARAGSAALRPPRVLP